MMHIIFILSVEIYVCPRNSLHVWNFSTRSGCCNPWPFSFCADKVGRHASSVCGEPLDLGKECDFPNNHSRHGWVDSHVSASAQRNFHRWFLSSSLSSRDQEAISLAQEPSCLCPDYGNSGYSLNSQLCVSWQVVRAESCWAPHAKSH